MADKRREGERERRRKSPSDEGKTDKARKRRRGRAKDRGVSTLCLEARQLPLYQRDNLVTWNSPRIQPSPSVVGR